MRHKSMGYKTPKESNTDRKGQYTKKNKTAEKLGPSLKMVIKQDMPTSSKIDVIGLHFLEDFPICQYRTKHFGRKLEIYILGMLSFRQNKINVPTSQDFLLLVPK